MFNDFNIKYKAGRQITCRLTKKCETAPASETVRANIALIFLTIFLTVRYKPLRSRLIHESPGQDGPKPVSNFRESCCYEIVLRFCCDICHSTIAQHCAVRWTFENARMNIVQTDQIYWLSHGSDAAASADWGCESKRPGMYGRWIIVTSSNPISQRYLRLCILKSARNRVLTIPISLLRLEARVQNVYPYS